MKISLNAVKKYLDFELPPIDELVDKIGAQLGAVDEIIDLGAKYKGIFIVKVVNCSPHPNADKLSLCTIDDGGVVKEVPRDGDGNVQVVCGAPNVKAGQTVAWLPPGSTVPSSVDSGEPFVLASRDIRGQVSHGMIASPQELALGDSHEGILIIEGDHKPGTDFAATFDLKDEVIIDIENKMFTHRPDLFGTLGVARELAGIHQQPFKQLDWYNPKPTFPTVATKPLALGFKNELPELVPRFMAITIRDVKVEPSPAWLQIELAKLGQKSINNIVDYTNWLMLTTGQPLHAYDYDKVKALSADEATIVVRNPRSGEKVKLLNGKEIEPRAEAIMIATDKQLIGVGGIMGGAETEVDTTTKNIILECANFNMYSIRRTSMEHGLFTEASTRFTKGQSPLQNPAILKLMIDYAFADSQVASHEIDDNHLDPAVIERNSLHLPVRLTADFINDRLGLKLAAEEMKKLLENVEFVVEITGDELNVTAPFWRTDIELREDVVEEIGRLYGYDHLPLVLPTRDLTPAHPDPLLGAKAEVRAKLSKSGANEVLAYSFVHGDLLEKVGQDKARAFQVANALSPDLQYYRLSLMPSLLEKVHSNVKAGYNEFALFEIGKTHGLDNAEDDEGLPREFEFTALVVTAADKLKKLGAAYYQARKYLESLVGDNGLEFKPVSDDMKGYAVVQPYDINRSALVSLSGGEFLGIIGEFKPSVTSSLKLPKYTAGFEVDTTVLHKLLQSNRQYRPLPRFPKITQDISLKVPVALAYQGLFDFLKSELDKAKPSNSLLTLSPLDIYQREEDKAHNQMAFRLSIASYERTLTDKEVNKLLDEVAAAAKAELGTERL